MNKIDLDKKVAVVTGGASGIGQAITSKLIESGASLSLWDCDQAALANFETQGIHSVVMNVTDQNSVNQALHETLSTFSQIDLLVNSAGIIGLNCPTWKYPADEWQRVLDTDLSGVFYCCQAVIPTMIANNYGRVVNISSIGGKEGNPEACAYSAAKAGVIALTKTLGKELATYNISVNCITPSLARTPAVEQLREDFFDYCLEKVPRKRLVEPEEIAAMVAWLLSEENSFATGAVFDCSGGRASY